MASRLFLSLAALLSLTLSACQRTAGGGVGADGDTLSYARLLRFAEREGLLEVTIADPWQSGRALQTIVLGEDGAPNALPTLRRVVVFTTAHCQLLEWLGAEGKIVGVADADYIHVDAVRRGLERGTIVDCGSAMSPDIEKIIALKPDAIIASPFEGSGGFGKLEKLGIPIIQAADYMEDSALGRAEWMRYYGRLVGAAQRADSLFHVVDSSYHALKRRAAQLPMGRSLLTERKTGATWYVPGGSSTVAAVIRDAHGGYAFSDDSHSGSLPLSFEQVLDKAGESDVWAFKVYGTGLMNSDDLLREYHGYKWLRAFQTGNIYECNTMTSRYFEETPFRPDYLLREIMILLHPNESLGKLRYYRKMD